jgi:hypothetical protein
MAQLFELMKAWSRAQSLSSPPKDSGKVTKTTELDVKSALKDMLTVAVNVSTNRVHVVYCTLPRTSACENCFVCCQGDRPSIARTRPAATCHQ